MIEEIENPDDLKSPEWNVFSNPAKAKPSRSFKLRTVEPPTDFAKYFEKIVLVEKLREVRALVGFTRLMSPRDFDSPAELPPDQRAKISRKEPDKLGRHIRRALEKMKLCASDPLCSEHTVGSGEKLHGASCHACSFLPETSCERGNKYLDRSALIPTVERTKLAFFE